MRIGIYGGTFNPIHLGHTSLAKAICDAKLVDEIWLMVSPLNPLKRNQQTELLHHSIRFEMAQLALENESQIKASDFEMHLPLPSYTINTLRALQTVYPAHEFVLLVGEDNWERFHQWYSADEIKQNFDIIVYGRAGENKKENEDVNRHDARVQLFPHGKRKRTLRRPFQLYRISSTEIREALKNKDDSFAEKWLHPSVFQYIRDHQLYS